MMFLHSPSIPSRTDQMATFTDAAGNELLLWDWTVTDGGFKLWFITPPKGDFAAGGVLAEVMARESWREIDAVRQDAA